MKHLVVVHFGPKGPRIHQGPDAARLASHPDSLVNPEIPPGVPPHLWVKQGNRIGVSKEPVPHKPSMFHLPSLAAGALAGLLIGSLLSFLF